MLTRPQPPAGITVYFEGLPVRALPGESLATCLIAAGIASTFQTARSGAMRGAWCLAGACFDCMAVVDGVAGQRCCLVQVADGMQVERQLDPPPGPRADE